jgi:EmrB/QacA subfamily drug resistance transporter
MASKKLSLRAMSIQRKWWVLLSVGIGTFMSALDSSVVNTVLPIVRRDFGSDVAAIEWVVTVYLLIVSGLLLSFGRLGDLRGHKPVYALGFVIFVLSSALCGLALAVGALVAFRALQAVGAAMLFANAPAILTKNFPPTQRGQALGMQATMTYLGLTVGPSLGGWLTEQFSWRAVFYINVPVGLLALLLCLRFIPPDEQGETSERFDMAGALTFMAGLVALLFGLNRGHAWGWDSPAILGLLAGAVALLGFFVFSQRRAPFPMLDLSLFASRVFSVSTASALLNYICLYSITFLLPFYLIQGREFGPAHAGLLLTAQPIVMLIAAPLSGTLSDRIGSRWLATAGMAILAAGLFLLSRLDGQSPLYQVTLSLMVCGLGTGIFISPNNSALMGAAPRRRQGIASGILATSRNLGMVLGVGMAGAILTTVLARGEALGSETALFPAVQAGFFVASGIAALGSLVLLIHGLGVRPRSAAEGGV